MKSKRLYLLTISLVLSILLFCFSSVAIAAPLDGSNDNGPPVNVVVVVHYPHQADRVLSGVVGGVLFEGFEGDGFIYEGVRWENPSISYYVNLSRQDSAFLAGITESFNTWNDVSTSSFKATYEGSTRSSPGSLQAKWNRKTGSFTGNLNVVGWKNLRRYPGAIGVTYYWYYTTGTGENYLIEVDTALNSSSEYHWWQIETSDETWNQVDSSAYDVDVQNIMTHEAGHWLVLGDLYEVTDADETMYGYADESELKKRSLEDGDKAGIAYIY